MYHIDTTCIHAGYEPGNGEPRVVPIVQSTTFKYATSEEMGKLFDLEADGFFYTRLANPTLDAVEKKIAALEGGVGAMLTSSGQAATMMSVLNICHAGQHVICSTAVYGGTFNLFYKTLQELGIEFTFVDPGITAEELDTKFQENTRCVFVETLSNPSLVVTDLELFAGAAHRHGVRFPLSGVPQQRRKIVRIDDVRRQIPVRRMQRKGNVRDPRAHALFRLGIGHAAHLDAVDDDALFHTCAPAPERKDAPRKEERENTGKNLFHLLPSRRENTSSSASDGRNGG